MLSGQAFLKRRPLILDFGRNSRALTTYDHLHPTFPSSDARMKYIHSQESLTIPDNGKSPVYLASRTTEFFSYSSRPLILRQSRFTSNLAWLLSRVQEVDNLA